MIRFGLVLDRVRCSDEKCKNFCMDVKANAVATGRGEVSLRSLKLPEGWQAITSVAGVLSGKDDRFAFCPVHRMDVSLRDKIPEDDLDPDPDRKWGSD